MKRLLLFILVIVLFSGSSTVQVARVTSKLNVKERLVTPTTTIDVTQAGLDELVVYSDGSTRYDADHVYVDTLKGENRTLDLTSLTNSQGESLDLTGETIVAAKFKLEDDSGAYVTIAEGSSNGYPLFGASFSFKLQANQSILFIADTVISVVGTSDKTIDFTFSNDSTILYIMLLTADSYI